MLWYKGKQVTLDLVVGLTLSVMALGTLDHAQAKNVITDNNLTQTISEQIVSVNQK